MVIKIPNSFTAEPLKGRGKIQYRISELTFGDWTSNLEEVEKCLIDYFQELFTSANLQHNAAATDSINKVTSNEMNAQLSTEFKAWEVQQTIK